ncbi:MAG: hypothetical protein KYX64_06110 [Sphingopyxis sp.]|nr:hypothetical protein [Sphingopyxis sp.]
MGHRGQNGVGGERLSVRLDRLEARLDRLLSAIETMAAASSEPAPSPDHAFMFTQTVRPTSFPKARARMVRETIGRRRKRNEHFPSDLFADPAWDIMLHLYAARYENECMSVPRLCIAAGVPQATALRWITMLTNDGWLTRFSDRSDPELTHFKLSDRARGLMDAYFDDLPS